MPRKRARDWSRPSMAFEKGEYVSIAPVLRCGVDYLTTTWPMEIRDTIMESTRNVMDWARTKAVPSGSENWVKPWSWQGYVGNSCGPVSIGQRPDSCILRLSGIAAHMWLADGLTAGHNISRLDICATYWSDLDQSTILARHKEETVEHRNALQSRPYRVRLIDGVGDGDTLYIGSRESQLWLRLYDKEREQKASAEWKGALRYEAECKEELARQAYSGCTLGGYSVANCLAVLGGLLDRRGISPVYPGGISSRALPHNAIPATDLATTLLWIRTQVAPSVRKLWREGYEQELLEALGLSRLWDIYQSGS